MPPKRKRGRSVTIEDYDSEDDLLLPEVINDQDEKAFINREIRGRRGNVSVNASVVKLPHSKGKARNTNDTPSISLATQEESEPNDQDDIQGSEPAPTPSDTPLNQWTASFRSLYLDELLRHYGRAGSSTGCSCGTEGRFRCKDCTSPDLQCSACIIARHSHTPCHRIEKWTGSYFSKASLSELGLVVTLAHSSSEECRIPGELRLIHLVDLSGHHSINVRFCSCQGLSDQVQMLRLSWFPASLYEPRTAFTFDALNMFHTLTLQSKVSAYDFYKTLERRTEDPTKVKPRYDQFLYCMRIYRHLNLLLRGGVGQDPLGISGIKPGDLAVECPACPHPGINLPEDWKNAPETKKWLYTLRLTIDANFRLKNKDRNITHDHSLGDGWAHWVPLDSYMSHVQRHKGQDEPNLCDSDLRAVDHANSKRSAGYASTGVGGVVCARHGLVRKNGMGSLQVGERYANMDFITLYTLKSTQVDRLLLSYDIGCQWFRNFEQRINDQHPPDRHLPRGLLANTTIMIPKFHIYGHGHSCQVRYSSNFLPWCAQTDGEDPERWWAHINPVSMSTRLMGPGARLDTIDDHAMSWNLQKIIGFGDSLSEKFRVAAILSKQHTDLHAQFSASFPDNTVAAWEKLVVAWEKNPRRKNPFDDGVIRSTMADVRLALAREEEIVAPPTVEHETSMHLFVYQGLELEEDQRALKASIKEKTTLQGVDSQEKRNTLAKRILSWLKLQALYMPTVATATPTTIARAETFRLPMPSSFENSPEITSIQSIESRLRIAQADDAITDLKRLLRISAGIKDYKVSQAGHGQGANTRMRALLSRYQLKVDLASDRYRAARQALVSLKPAGDWMNRFLPLDPKDVRWPGRRSDESESRREVSWIWLNNLDGQNLDPAIAASDSDMDISLRAEWARSRARAHRWQEELTLVHEEMRRVISYLRWKSSWWTGRASLRESFDAPLGEGIAAHAHHEAAFITTLYNTFLATWSPQTSAEGLILM